MLMSKDGHAVVPQLSTGAAAQSDLGPVSERAFERPIGPSIIDTALALTAVSGVMVGSGLFLSQRFAEGAVFGFLGGLGSTTGES
jgi:hypothetical protein